MLSIFFYFFLFFFLTSDENCLTLQKTSPISLIFVRLQKIFARTFLNMFPTEGTQNRWSCGATAPLGGHGMLPKKRTKKCKISNTSHLINSCSTAKIFCTQLQQLVSEAGSANPGGFWSYRAARGTQNLSPKTCKILNFK